MQILNTHAIMATAALQTKPMQSVVLSFSPSNNNALHFIEMARKMDFLTVSDSPYDPAYVANVKAMRKNTFKAVKREDLWS